MRKIKKKLFRIVPLILGAWLVIGTIIFIAYPAWLADKDFIDLKYRSVIHQIEYRPGHRGAPHIKFDSAWYLLTIDEMYIVPYIQVGDSIVKEKGVREVKVYRRGIDGRFTLKTDID
jgi:hypothetical protein